MSDKISILVGLKNNLDYTRNFYATTRALYPEAELVFVSHNSTDGTHEWLDSLSDSNLIYYYDTQEKSLSDTYNRATLLATREFVLYAHNDMILAPLFLENLEKQVNKAWITVYTTIEPPIYSEHERDGKIIEDFGDDLQNVDIKGIFAFTADYLQKLKERSVEVNTGAFFMCLDKNVLLDLGGLDPLFNPMFCEEDDLLIRLKFAGLKVKVALDVVCYHFVSKTSRFSEDFIRKTKSIESSSIRNFIRKWHFSNISPVKKTYDIGIVLTNANNHILSLLEPRCSCLYTDKDVTEYIKSEQPKTAFDLKAKIKPLSEAGTHDVMVYADGNKIKGNKWRKAEVLNEVIYHIATHKMDWFTRLYTRLSYFNPMQIVIHRNQTHERGLIKRQMAYHENR